MVDKKYKVAGLFADLSKAFDLVDHRLLLDKLEFYGIRGISHDFFRSYLTNRYQRVEIKDDRGNSFFSTWKSITYGVPQGSVLGPLLFILYINDLPSFLSPTKTTLFVDDTNIVMAGEDEKELALKLNTTISSINSWMKANGLVLNQNKTKVITFNLKKTTESDNIATVKTAPFLGIEIDDNLKWNSHIKSLSNKLNRANFVIRNLLQLVDQDTLLTVYHAYFHSVMTYGILHWGSSSGRDIIFKIQKRAIRTIGRISPWETCRDLFKHYGILTVASCYIFEVFKFFTINESLLRRPEHFHDTRSRVLFKQNKHSLSVYQNSAHFNGTYMFNSLPKSIRDLKPNRKKFLSIVKKYLLENVLYTVEEFIASSEINTESNPRTHSCL